MYCQECGNKYENENSKFCSSCGTKNSNGASYCQECGTLKTHEKQDVCLNCGEEFNKIVPSFEKSEELNDGVSKKLKIVYLILWFFFAGIGAHRFYVEDKKGGFWMLGLTLAGILTCGITNLIVAVMAIIDLVNLVSDKVVDDNGKVVQRWN